MIINCFADVVQNRKSLIGKLDVEVIPSLSFFLQPTEEELKSYPFLSRFTLNFDRKGYSPGFFNVSTRDAALLFSRWSQEIFFRIHDETLCLRLT